MCHAHLLGIVSVELACVDDVLNRVRWLLHNYVVQELPEELVKLVPLLRTVGPDVTMSSGLRAEIQL